MSDSPPGKGWHLVGRASDYEHEDVEQAVIGDHELAIYRVKDQFYATDDVCTHEHAYLSDGVVVDDIVECPMHQGRFHIPSRTGDGGTGDHTGVQLPGDSGRRRHLRSIPAREAITHRRTSRPAIRQRTNYRLTMSSNIPVRTLPPRWTETVDIVVVGYGYAGAVAAIEAADAGASVLLIEKMADPGGISICSGGNVRIADDADKAFAYLKETNAGTTPDDVLRVLADGMTQVPAYFEKLATPCGASIDGRQADGNYPLAGTDTFGYVSIESVPDYDPVSRYPYVSSYLPPLRAAGMRLFKVIEDNIASRDIDVWLETEALRLGSAPEGEVRGLAYRRNGELGYIQARKAVVLACGGFEADEEMQRQLWQEKPVLLAAYKGNTGDGIRMAQDMGAALWHMWHYHGTYGFKHTNPEEYPYGIRFEAPAGLDPWQCTA